ncbi:MAG: hypothetical protein ABWY93_18700 [Mycobacterium sp.]
MIKVQGEPDFYPYQLDVDALPPAGMAVDIDGRPFTVESLILRSSERPTGRRTYYEVVLAAAGPAPGATS